MRTASTGMSNFIRLPRKMHSVAPDIGVAHERTRLRSNSRRRAMDDREPEQTLTPVSGVAEVRVNPNSVSYFALT